MPSISLAMRTTPQQLVLAHKKRSSDELFASVLPSLSTRPLVQINTFFVQEDKFSCVYRSIFHAQCITLALKKITQSDSFEKNLKMLLQDESLLNQTFRNIKKYLDAHHPDFDKSTGLSMHHVLGACAASIPILHTKLLPVFLEDDKKIYAMHDPTLHLPSPLHYSSDFIRKYETTAFLVDTCRVELDKSKELTHQLAQLDGPTRIAHFVCRYPCPPHVFMASIITDEQCCAKLYVIDSNNTPVPNPESFLTLISKILEYTEAHNANLTQQFAKKQKTTPVVALLEKKN